MDGDLLICVMEQGVRRWETEGTGSKTPFWSPETQPLLAANRVTHQGLCVKIALLSSSGPGMCLAYKELAYIMLCCWFSDNGKSFFFTQITFFESLVQDTFCCNMFWLTLWTPVAWCLQQKTLFLDCLLWIVMPSKCLRFKSPKVNKLSITLKSGGYTFMQRKACLRIWQTLGGRTCG